MNNNEQSKVYSSWCKHVPWRNMCMTDSTTIAGRYFVNHNKNNRQQAKQTLLKFFEILQFRAKFEISLVSCWRFAKVHSFEWSRESYNGYLKCNAIT